MHSMNTDTIISTVSGVRISRTVSGRYRIEDLEERTQTFRETYAEAQEAAEDMHEAR